MTIIIIILTMMMINDDYDDIDLNNYKTNFYFIFNTLQCNYYLIYLIKLK